MSKVSEKTLEIVAEAIKAEIRKGNSTWHDTARAVLEAVSSIHEAEPVWGDAGTVGNLVAQLRTFAPETPIYGAFHADAGDGRKARVRGLTLSRERVDGRLIDTGNVLVPYSIVVWSAPDERPAPISKGVTIKALEWTQSRVFGFTKWRGSFPGFGELYSFNDDNMTAEEVIAQKAVSQADFAARILSCLSHTAGEIE